MRVLRPVLDVAGTILIALVILGAWFSLLFGSLGEGAAEAVRVLFNFMDVGLGVWAVLLIVFTIRRTLTAGRAYLFLVIGAVLNALTVVTVGFIQGGWAPLLVLFAIQAGFACLVAAAIAVPVVHRATAGRVAP
jgi:hypothetical protein